MLPNYRIAGIPTTIIESVRQTMRSPQYGHPAYRERATGTGPCRACLRTFAVGSDERILFTYQPFTEPGSLPAPGPVFIHAEACERYDDLAVPPDFRTLPLVLEAYGPAGVLLRQERVGVASAEAAIERLLADTEAGYLHVRQGEAGCFMARVDRCFVCD